MSLLKYDIDDILIKSDQKITDKVINESFYKLIQNDLTNVPTNLMKPMIWERKWFNNPSIPGYSQGDACWINTEDADEFVKFKHNQIYNYVRNNSYLASITPKYDPNNYEVHELYKSILSGYYNIRTGVSVDSIFYLGDITEKTQIRISKIDNNKFDVMDDRYWTNYFYHNEMDINNFDSEKIWQSILNKHIEDYHLSNKNINTSEYVTNTLKDVTKIQRLQKHTCEIHKDLKQGLDYVRSYTSEKSKNNYINVEISSMECIQEEDSIYELIDDVVYQLNNYIPKDQIELKLKNVKNYETISKFIPTEPLKTFGNITLEIAPTSAYPTIGLNFPNYFKYTDEYYEKVKDNLSDYYIRDYCIGEITTSTPHPDISTYYSPITPLSVDDLFDVPSNLRGKYIEIKTTKELSSRFYDQKESYILSHWIKHYKSGYVVQGGFCQLSNTNIDTIVPIPIKQAFEYPTTQYSIYGDVSKINSTLNYAGQNELKCDNRYIISITPISDSFNESDNIEIIGIQNDKFYILVKPTTPKQFFYQIQGIIEYE